jgi:hypothetical protein
MKRFLGILVVSMFLGLAAHAQETPVPKSRAETEDRKVGFTGEQKTGEKNKSDVKSGTVPPSRAETEDRKVGFTGEQKTGEKNKSDVKSGTVPPSRAETEDRKVGFTGEQKTPNEK